MIHPDEPHQVYDVHVTEYPSTPRARGEFEPSGLAGDTTLFHVLLPTERPYAGDQPVGPTVPGQGWRISGVVRQRPSTGELIPCLWVSYLDADAVLHTKEYPMTPGVYPVGPIVVEILAPAA